MRTPSRHFKRCKPESKQSVKKIRLTQCHAVVIGAGAIGRAVAILLASIGIKHMSIYDPAIVTRKDLAQGFMDFDVGMAKVDAVANIAHQQNPRMEILTYRGRFGRPHLQKLQSGLDNAVFLCVDSITARKSIWNRIKHAAHFLCDGRLGAEVIRVLASERSSTDTYYQSTFLPSKRSSMNKYSCDLVTATIAVGFMVTQFSRWLRYIPIIPDQVFNLLAHELFLLEARNGIH